MRQICKNRKERKNNVFSINEDVAEIASQEMPNDSVAELKLPALMIKGKFENINNFVAEIKNYIVTTAKKYGVEVSDEK